MTIRTLLVDDEPLARQRLRDLGDVVVGQALLRREVRQRNRSAAPPG